MPTIPYYQINLYLIWISSSLNRESPKCIVWRSWRNEKMRVLTSFHGSLDPTFSSLLCFGSVWSIYLSNIIQKQDKQNTLIWGACIPYIHWIIFIINLTENKSPYWTQRREAFGYNWISFYISQSMQNLQIFTYSSRYVMNVTPVSSKYTCVPYTCTQGCTLGRLHMFRTKQCIKGHTGTSPPPTYNLFLTRDAWTGLARPQKYQYIYIYFHNRM